VELIRDGRSFATRTVRALQRGAVIFVLTASFQRLETSPLKHGMPSPVDRVPAPETLHVPSPEEYAQTIYQIVKDTKMTRKAKISPVVALARNHAKGEELLRTLELEFASRPIDFRYVSQKDVKRPTHTSPVEFRQYNWFKVNGTISDDPQSHAVALAYASDHNLLNAALQSHGTDFSFFDISVMVSLDHSIYFHGVCSSKGVI
jgi:acyl-CoA thioesterase II